MQEILDKIDKTRCKQVALSSHNNPAGEFVENKGWFKRKKLIDFYPLS
ncbi:MULTISPECIES: hypothetical protein [spotted fever group]|nr:MULTISPECIES: hypothetical protein [spotted fever group]EER21731.1 hypothetical protein REIS_0905 [Rickettsia endosymbiont of Ixodes scapularis]EER22375.1 hypothetical protein REIS_1595 [Rickettsia endosymbiont of Ixodes scapularis]